MMKNIFTILLCFVWVAVTKAQTSTPQNGYEAELKPSNFTLGVQMQTKYVWRGMEMQSNEAAPVLFPAINYTHGGFAAYALGGYALNGKYGEVDLGGSYTKGWFTFGIADYYYASTTTKQDQYFNLKSRETGHWFEGYVIIAPPHLPLSLTISNFFAGADKDANGKQAYSTYMEIGTWYDFLNDNRLALNVGAAFNESCYNDYQHGMGICNVEAKYTHTLHFNHGKSLPLSVSYIINPIFEKSFVNFSANVIF